jgi:chemotaxis protein methyltransferase CheR
MRRIAALVYETTGIVLDDSRHALVVGRLGKRLRALKMSSYHEYVRLLFERDKDGAELGNLVNAITTNKTSFFREAHHFTYLKERIEERMRAAEGRPELRRLAIWSAACSTGEEPYSIAMTVADTLGSDLSSWRVQIFATDIDTDVLAFAERGVYGRERTQGLPASVTHHFAQS